MYLEKQLLVFVSKPSDTPKGSKIKYSPASCKGRQ